MYLYAKLKGIPKAKRKEQVDNLLGRVMLPAAGDGGKVGECHGGKPYHLLTLCCSQAVRTYSGGMKRRLSVAIACLGNPRVLILDEPTTGLDPISRRQVWTLIEDMKPGRAVLLTTHNLADANSLADKVLCATKALFRWGPPPCVVALS